MALSRIWSAFILISILVAVIKFAAFGEKQIFSSMVVGKKGDSVQVKTSALAAAEASRAAAVLDSSGRVSAGDVKVRIQVANGIVDTCKDAVTLCIELIGMLALFMGFMSIAERAGGINLLSRIIGPFFSKLFPEVPRGHPAMGHMIMNFSANLLGLDDAATPLG